MANDTIAAPEQPAPPPLRMTYDEFLDWYPGEGVRAEWVGGEVQFMGEISDTHNKLGLFVITLLNFWVQEHDSSEVKYEPFNMKLGGRLGGRSPDVMFIAKENLHRKSRKNLNGPADIAVEIVSEESRRRDRVEKFIEYETGGVREYWLLDPEKEEAEFYVLDAGRKYVRAEPDAEGRFHSAVLPGLWVEVDWLWERPLPTLRRVMAAWGLP